MKYKMSSVLFTGDMYVDITSITTLRIVYVCHPHPHRHHHINSVDPFSSRRSAERVYYRIQQIPNTKARTPILIQGTVLFTPFEADSDGPPEVAVPVADGVAREVAVPRTPLRVAPPSAAACEADDTLYISPAAKIRDIRLIGGSLDDGCTIEHPINQLHRQRDLILQGKGVHRPHRYW